MKLSIQTVAFHNKGLMSVDLSDGRIISVPLAWYPKLAGANKKQLKKYEISPSGYEFIGRILMKI